MTIGSIKSECRVVKIDTRCRRFCDPGRAPGGILTVPAPAFRSRQPGRARPRSTVVIRRLSPVLVAALFCAAAAASAQPPSEPPPPDAPPAQDAPPPLTISYTDGRVDIVRAAGVEPAQVPDVLEEDERLVTA